MRETGKAAVPAASIVIPCRNEVGHIESCLRRILRFDAPPGGFEVIVADGMSDDGTRAVIERVAAADERVRMIDNPRRTTPCALNLGIRAARGRVIVRIDGRTECAPDYLRRCLEVLEETGADNVGGPWVARGTSYVQSAIAAAFASPFACGGARGHRADHEGPVDTVYLGCWPREVLDRLGGFDEELIRNQDDELNFRLLRAGGKIWQSPRIRSWYQPRSSLADLFRQYWQYGYWKVRVLQKHGRPASLRHLIPASLGAAVLLLAPVAPVLWVAREGLDVLLLSYLLVLALASAATAARSRWALLPILPAVFPCFHLGYGLGFLHGLWDFAICRRRAGRCVSLTRGRARVGGRP